MPPKETYEEWTDRMSFNLRFNSIDIVRGFACYLNNVPGGVQVISRLQQTENEVHFDVHFIEGAEAGMLLKAEWVKADAVARLHQKARK